MQAGGSWRHGATRPPARCRRQPRTLRGAGQPAESDEVEGETARDDASRPPAPPRRGVRGTGARRRAPAIRPPPNRPATDDERRRKGKQDRPSQHPPRQSCPSETPHKGKEMTASTNDHLGMYATTPKTDDASMHFPVHPSHLMMLLSWSECIVVGSSKTRKGSCRRRADHGAPYDAGASGSARPSAGPVRGGGGRGKGGGSGGTTLLVDLPALVVRRVRIGRVHLAVLLVQLLAAGVLAGHGSAGRGVADRRQLRANAGRIAGARGGLGRVGGVAVGGRAAAARRTLALLVRLAGLILLLLAGLPLLADLLELCGPLADGPRTRALAQPGDGAKTTTCRLAPVG
jgi:hypothetical protein